MWPKLPQVYLQDSFQSRFIRMSLPAPPRLVDLASQSLLKDQALAIAALEVLPMELFPPLFTAAFAGRYSETLKAMVQAWPFACLPLGALMKEQQPHQEIFQAALDGLDVLLAQEPRPRRWKLQVLDLRKNAHQDFWTVWSGTRASIYSLLEPEVAQPVKKRQKVDSCRPGPKQTLAPVEVLIDLCLKEGTPDESLAYLIRKVKQGKGLLHLCCKKLKIFAMPMQNIKKILKMVQLDSIQDLEVNCTWKLSTLGKFALHLGQMGNLRRLLLSHIHMSAHSTPTKEEQCVSQFTSQFLRLHYLEELYLDSISFLKDRLDQVLSCLKTPLETLSITNCLLSESDLTHLSQHLNVSQLKDLGLSGVNLTCMSAGPLQVLIERASATLQDLDLDECGIMDSQFSAILPALSHCSQLMTFSFCGNPISMAVLEDLLHHTVGLSKLSHVLYPAPLESYEDVRGTLHLGRLAHLHARLKQMLQELGRPGMVWFSANLCPHCGDRTFYDPEPILCPCYMPV
ncbi:melanoma antigen preferentially expressed in tumors isoform X1 [Felis catus]|uniref:PRAME nuclear receptor transcriptional regulator n=2 Tax=Felis catus TaxID=9685 RepID=A0ABI7ZWF7_FELCA|nr:melanoma antigen preferentially expressed in tumors isoform X1 [Felis catus]XP_011286063.2 melanoma antigen preferentially expressed in tumors isoform X1 [Felis catus]XP_044897812.1 melanoma antigen preferentially expressed in tumors isoform X1 [Felis catus]